jgi:ABC-type polysaccharide/polyol phosphate transport system ATPase subunit
MKLIVENVSVEFPIYGAHRSLRKALFERATGGLIVEDPRRKDRVIVQALTDISLDLHEGDRLGLIGHNGAGKSTLLRTLAGVYEPVSGRIFVNGKITPLFEMLPGVDPEDSGYENVITAGALFGLQNDEIQRIILDVEEFSELGEYMGLPVRTYSQGMMTRLGFAFATSMEPGILLLDEGIGAGDARFADRAAERLESFIGRSRIVVVASHSNQLIRQMCNKAAFMHAGRIAMLGPVEEILEVYDAYVNGAEFPWLKSA